MRERFSYPLINMPAIAGRREPKMHDIENILSSAGKAGATDVHIAAGYSPAMRINGKLQKMDFPGMTASDTLEILLSVMTQTQRDRFEETGEYEMTVSLPGAGRCRVNAFKQQGDTALAFRLTGVQVPTMEELKMPECMTELCMLEQGLILVTGAAGHGKSATLAAMTDAVNSRREVYIVMLERTSEYKFSRGRAVISQREIGLDAEDFPGAVGHAVKIDADVIVVDQIENLKTLEAVIRAAQNGHLVLAAIPGNDIRDIFAEMTCACMPQHKEQVKESLGRVLKAVIFQEMQFRADGIDRTVQYRLVPEQERII